MNTRLKTVVTFALVVVLSAGLAMAGRGGGGGHGGGGGGRPWRRWRRRQRRRRRIPRRWRRRIPRRWRRRIPRAFFQHPASELCTASSPASEFQHAASRRDASVSAIVAAECRGQPPGHYAGQPARAGQRPGIANTPNWDNRLNAGNRANIDNRANIGNRAYVANRPNFGNNFNINRGRTTSSGRRMAIGTAATGITGIGTATGTTLGIIGRWAGGAAATGPAPPFPRFPGPGDIGRTTTPTTRARSSMAVQPSITRSRSWWPRRPRAGRRPSGSDRRATGDALARCGAECLHAGRLQDRAGPGGPGHCASAQRHRAPRVPRPGALRAGALQGSGCRRLCRALRRSRLGLDDAQRPLSGRGGLHGATPRLGAVRHIAPGRIGGEIPAGRELPDLRLHRCCRRTVQGSRATESQGPVVRPTAQEHFRSGLPRDTAQPAAPSQPAAPAKPADASSLVGNWTATRADSATIKLALAGDGKFTWALDQNGKPQQFSGTYTVADNLLVLKQGNNPMMVGQVASLAGDRFNFKLAGDNPSDPGLTFVR